MGLHQYIPHLDYGLFQPAFASELAEVCISGIFPTICFRGRGLVVNPERVVAMRGANPLQQAGSFGFAQSRDERDKVLGCEQSCRDLDFGNCGGAINQISVAATLLALVQ